MVPIGKLEETAAWEETLIAPLKVHGAELWATKNGIELEMVTAGTFVTFTFGLLVTEIDPITV